MKKLLTILAFTFVLGVFTSCEEEEIKPQDTLESTVGGGQDDSGQWD